MEPHCASIDALYNESESTTQSRASGRAIEADVRVIEVDLATDPEYAAIPEADTLT